MLDGRSQDFRVWVRVGAHTKIETFSTSNQPVNRSLSFIVAAANAKTTECHSITVGQQLQYNIWVGLLEQIMF